MPTTATATLEQLAERDYEWGFITDIEPETIPPGLSRGHRPHHLRQEERAGVAARLAAASPIATGSP